VKGFRPGHVPPGIVRERLDPEQLFEETVRQLLRTALPELVKTHDLHPILPPRVTAESRQPIAITVTVIEKPTARWKKKAPVPMEKKNVAIDPKEVEELIGHTLRRHESTAPVERAARHGDRVTINFRGADAEGAEIPGTAAENFDVTIGSNQLIPGFEEQLIDKAIGQEHAFTVTFPDDYHAEHLRKKPVTFTVQVKGVAEVTRPELTDAFAAEKLSLPTAAAVREAAESTIRNHRASTERMERENAYFDALANAVDADLADELVEEEMGGLAEQHAQRLQESGMTHDDWLARTKKTKEQFAKEMREAAHKRILIRLGLQMELDERKTELTEEEITAMIEEESQRLAQHNDAAKKQLRARTGDLYHQALWQRRVEKMLGEIVG
jgi:trigger factor